MIKQRNILIYRLQGMQENWPKQIRTIVPEVSSIVGNPVSVKMDKSFERLNSCLYRASHIILDYLQA